MTENFCFKQSDFLSVIGINAGKEFNEQFYVMGRGKEKSA